MAKSSSNNDPCSRAIQIIEALSASQCITGVDIFVLLGLCPMGALAHPLMAVGTGPDEDVNILNGVSLSYNEFIKQMKGAGIEHIASYVTPQPLQQISPSGKKIGGNPSSQKFATTEANLLQDATFKKAKESLQLQAPLLRLPAPLEQMTRTSTKRKIFEVEEVDPAVSPKGAKPSNKKIVKIVAKKSTTKKAKVVEVVPDSSIIRVEPLKEELDDTATLSNLALEAKDRRIAREYKEAKPLAAALKAKAKAKDVERKCLEAEVEKKRQADKAEEERIVEIKKRLEIKKKEKAQADKKDSKSLKRRKKKNNNKKREEERKEAQVVRRKARQVVPREARLTKQTAMVTMVSVQQIAHPAIEVKTSIEATAPLASNMPEGLGDIDKLLEDVSLTLQQCQTPTKTSSTPIPLEPSKDQLQAAIDQLKELLQKPVGLVLLDASLVDQFQQAAQEKRNQATNEEADHKQRVSKLQAHQLDLQTKTSELKFIDQKVKSLEAKL
uniref:Uncharacterized protein n=1 Tax=Fagus sylvatica TaxID=28930 RepID=A0A2N9I9T0_FAGSY